MTNSIRKTIPTLLLLSSVFLVGTVNASNATECFNPKAALKPVQKKSCIQPVLTDFCLQQGALQSCRENNSRITKIYRYVEKKYPDFDKNNIELTKHISNELIAKEKGLSSNLFNYVERAKRKQQQAKEQKAQEQTEVICDVETDKKVKKLLDNALNLIFDRPLSHKLSDEDIAEAKNCLSN